MLLLHRVWLGLLCLVSCAVAVYDDEAYITDWGIRQIGRLNNNVLIPGQGGGLINVITDAGVLAAIEDGDIRWRVQFEGLVDDQHLIAYDNEEGQKGKIVSALNYEDNRGVVQLWDAQTGFLYKQFAEFDHHVKGLLKTSKNEIVVVLSNGDIFSISHDHEEEDNNELVQRGSIDEFSDLKMSALDNGNYVILYNIKDSDYCRYAFFDGEALKSHALTLSYHSLREFYGSKIVYETIKYYTIQINHKTGEASKPIPINHTFDKLIPIDTDSYIAFEKNHNIEIHTLTGHEQFKIPNVFKYSLKFVDNTFVLYTEYHVNIIDADTGAELVSYFLGDEKLPFEQVVSISTSTNGIDEIHSLFQYTNNTYSYLFNNETIWTRDYSLSSIIDHTVVDVHVEVGLTTDEILYEENLSLIDAYLFRLKRHYKECKEFYDMIWSILPKLTTGEVSLNELNIFNQSPKNDEYFGFNKILVLATSTGRIIALNTLDGSTKWSFDTKQTDILSIENISNGSKIIVFTKSGPKFELDSKTGELLDQKILVPPTNVIKLDDDSFLFEIENGFDVIISENESEEEEDDDDDSIQKSKYIVKHDSKSIRGFKILDKKSYQTWKFEVNIDEVILGYASKDKSDMIANVGIVLGNRDVLYKYLYPNIASVGVLNKKTGILYIHIIDEITGEILYSTYHDEKIHLNGNFNIIVGEHWIIYSYYSNEPLPEQKISVIDLFESLTPNEKSNIPSNIEISSFALRSPPAVTSKSFICPYKIQSIGLSKTRFGVTTKAIILTLENSQVVYVPKFILNSRRVSGRDLTSDEKSEFMLLPYDPILMIDDNTVISHKREVFGSDTIVTIPTNLESTCIICTYGLDVFCTRISPSLQFDRLTSSFDKVKLVGSLVLLIIAVAILRRLNQMRSLKKLWIVEERK